MNTTLTTYSYKIIFYANGSVKEHSSVEFDSQPDYCYKKDNGECGGVIAAINKNSAVSNLWLRCGRLEMPPRGFTNHNGKIRKNS